MKLSVKTYFPMKNQLYLFFFQLSGSHIHNYNIQYEDEYKKCQPFIKTFTFSHLT